jgi:hypothetical protein
MTSHSNRHSTTFDETVGRLTATLIRIRMEKLTQLVKLSGNALEDVLIIKRGSQGGWRIGPAHPFPLKPREVEPLTLAIRKAHYRIGWRGNGCDDASTHQLGREVAEFLDLEGVAKAKIRQRAKRLHEGFWAAS